MFDDISGWDKNHRSHGRCTCWDKVPEDVAKRALEMMRELREMSSDLSINISIWPLSEEMIKWMGELNEDNKL